MAQPDANIKRIVLEEVVHFDHSLELDSVPHIEAYVDPNCSVEDYDEEQQRIWHMPQFYKELDIAKYVLDKCSNEAELQRVGQELLLYHERDLFDLLRYLVYLVDTMRQHRIIWGVGRGSSIASYVLYILGVHRINSLVYDLDIGEFFK
jgi:DNA polymerase III alpha subunit